MWYFSGSEDSQGVAEVDTELLGAVPEGECTGGSFQHQPLVQQGLEVIVLLHSSLMLFNFKLYLFCNNNTWIQIGHELILLGGE